MNINRVQPPSNGGIVPPWLIPPLDPDTPRIWPTNDGYERIIGRDTAAWIAQQRREMRYQLTRRELANG